MAMASLGQLPMSSRKDTVQIKIRNEQEVARTIDPRPNTTSTPFAANAIDQRARAKVGAVVDQQAATREHKGIE